MTEPSIEEIVALLEGMIASNRNPTGWEEKVGEFSRALIASWRERGEERDIAIRNVVTMAQYRDRDVEAMRAKCEANARKHLTHTSVGGSCALEIANEIAALKDKP